MKKEIISAILAAALTAPIVSVSAAAPGDDFADKYFNKASPELTTREKTALSIAKKWEVGSPGTPSGMQPVTGSNGAINFVYGAQLPSIVCAVLQVCDVSLQPGELVNSLHLGDLARWTVDPAITGSGPTETQHLIIKPMDVGLETSLVVTTNRRTYHFKLRSHRTEYMPQVAFTYPEDALAKWEAIKSRETHERQEKIIPQTGEYLGDLNFDYEVEGDASWKPVRVYNDGTKTIIEMAKAMQQTDSPTLLVVRKDGGFFTDEQTAIVNYRVQGDRYIVDQVFEKAILISGVGDDQDRITITKRN
jgi:type IV secretion system protein VirB9